MARGWGREAQGVSANGYGTCFWTGECALEVDEQFPLQKPTEVCILKCEYYGM